MNTPALQFINVTKIYLAPRNGGSGIRHEAIALDAINLTIQPGERVGIIGRNGAGKTTFLRAIGGTINLTSGRVICNSFPRVVIALGGSFLGQFSGHENIYLYASLLGLLKKEVDQLYNEIVTFSGLQDVINEPLRNYSNGMRARLAFAIATAGTPNIICLDELMAAGDLEFQKRSAERLARLSRADTTTVITHHNLGTLCEYASRLIWLENGRVRGDGKPEKIRAQYEASAR